MDRREFFGMAGLNANETDGAYTPVSLGKGNKVKNGNASWIASLKKADFTDAVGLRALTPETVAEAPVIVNDVAQEQYKAIVGDVTGKVYSIKSNKYIPVQNQLLVDAVAQVSENTDIQVFGNLRDEGGRMSLNAFFADPDCNVDFGGHGQKDPYMLGVRAYNSHLGDKGFGAHMVGVRWMCSNMMSFGKNLGKVSWKHFVKEEKVVDLIGSMIESYMDRVPVLKDKIEAMRSEEITITEAECLLWGIKVSPFQIEGMMENMPELNPEIRHKNGKVSVYDTMNVVTAYNSYANTGGSEFGRIRIADKAESLIGANIDDLIGAGMEAKTRYEEAQEARVLKITKASDISLVTD